MCEISIDYELKLKIQLNSLQPCVRTQDVKMKRSKVNVTKSCISLTAGS